MTEEELSYPKQPDQPVGQAGFPHGQFGGYGGGYGGGPYGGYGGGGYAGGGYGGGGYGGEQQPDANAYGQQWQGDGFQDEGLSADAPVENLDRRSELQPQVAASGNNVL